MKMSERIKRNMQPDKPMTLISLRLPEHVIDDLKEVAPSLGFGGYQALIRAYISNGLRVHLAERKPSAPRTAPSRSSAAGSWLMEYPSRPFRRLQPKCGPKGKELRNCSYKDATVCEK